MPPENELQTEQLISNYKLAAFQVAEKMVGNYQISHAGYSTVSPVSPERRAEAEGQYQTFYQAFLDLTTRLFKDVGGQKAFDTLTEVFQKGHTNGRWPLDGIWKEQKKTDFYTELLIKVTTK